MTARQSSAEEAERNFSDQIQAMLPKPVDAEEFANKVAEAAFEARKSLIDAGDDWPRLTYYNERVQDLTECAVLVEISQIGRPENWKDYRQSISDMVVHDAEYGGDCGYHVGRIIRALGMSISELRKKATAKGWDIAV